MNRLASTIADLIRDKLALSPGGDQGEVRLIFHGPQREILTKVFDLLTKASDGGPKVPILLQLPDLAIGEETRRSAFRGVATTLTCSTYEIHLRSRRSWR